MAVSREKAAHIWERDEHDWYVEPYECSLALFEAEEMPDPIWDPACGLGRILWSGKEYNKDIFGSDIVRRSTYCNVVSDFFSNDFRPKFFSIVSNPPFRHAENFVRRAIAVTPEGGKIAMLLPLVWMAGFSAKRDWLPESPLRRIYSISPRPSMPPGAVIAAGIRPGNGTKDFAWFVWEKGFSGSAELRFLNTKAHKLNLTSRDRPQLELVL